MPKKTRTVKPPVPEAAAAVQAAAEWAQADSLVEWAGNPRTDQPVEEVALSILRLGFGAPIVARRANRQIIAGHTRLKAFRFLQAHVRDVTDDSWSPRGEHDGVFVVRDAPGPGLVPVRFVDVTEAEAQALALADNRLGEKALWDDDALAVAVRELRGWDFPTAGLGWTFDEIGDMLNDIRPADGDPPKFEQKNPPTYAVILEFSAEEDQKVAFESLSKQYEKIRTVVA